MSPEKRLVLFSFKKLSCYPSYLCNHTFSSCGVPIIDVSRALGHAKVSTTLDIYGHAIPENKKMIADKISAAFLK